MNALYERIRDLIITARQNVSRGVDLVQVWTNFEMGRYIVEDEQRGVERAAYGQTVLKKLAQKLTGEFGRGFSKSNLEYARRFFLLYQERIRIAQFETGRLAVVSGKPPSFRLGWTHYLFLMGIKNPDERSFYEIEAAGQGWNLKELKRQFDSSLYERLALSRDKAGIRNLARKGQIVDQPKDLLKEPLVLEFLGLDEQARYSESDLETAIINRTGLRSPQLRRKKPKGSALLVPTKKPAGRPI